MDHDTAIEAGEIVQKYHDALKAHNEAALLLVQRKKELESARVDAENLIDAAKFKLPRSRAEITDGSKRSWVKRQVELREGKTSILDVMQAARKDGAILSYRYAAQMLASLAKAGEIAKAGHGLYCRAVVAATNGTVEAIMARFQAFIEGKTVVSIADIAGILGGGEADAVQKMGFIGFVADGKGNVVKKV